MTGAGESASEGAGEGAGEDTVAEVRRLEESNSGCNWYKLPDQGLEGKRVRIVSLAEEDGVWVAEYMVEKARTKTAKLPVRCFVPTGDRPKAKRRCSSSGGGGSSSTSHARTTVM